MVIIIQNGEPVLRELAQTVPVKEIASERIQKVITDMQIALSSQGDGVAIAAPQIGVPLRIFVVSGSVLKNAVKDYKGNGEDQIYINPEIIKLSRGKELLEEGCLSVRWLYGKVKRSKQVTLTAFDETGKKIERGASGLLAQIFQHETDHLNGVLFIDKASEIEEVLPEDSVTK